MGPHNDSYGEYSGYIVEDGLFGYRYFIFEKKGKIVAIYADTDNVKYNLLEIIN